MPSQVLHDQAQAAIRNVPTIASGYTVRVHEKVMESGKERVQIFEGLVIAVHRGHVATDAGFTVRRIISGVGVEKVFAIHSPNIEKIEVKKVAKTRRAKLYFLRGRAGKSARMIERYTSAGEAGMSGDGKLKNPSVSSEAGASSAAQDVAAAPEATEEKVSA